MAGDPSTAGSTESGGLLASVRRLVGTFVAAAQTRLQLFASDFEAEGQRLRRMFVLLGLAIVFLGLALVLVSILIVLAFWDGNRLLAVTLLAGLYAALGAVCLLMAKNCATAAPRPFAATLDELRKDREGLSQ